MYSSKRYAVSSGKCMVPEKMACHATKFPGSSGFSRDWSYLPANVVTSIIENLNSRCIGDMRLVCKTWHSLITKSITNLALSRSYPGSLPLPSIPLLFPLVTCLDLSCEEWGRGQSLKPELCEKLNSLHLLNSLHTLKLENWCKISKNGLDSLLLLPHLKSLDLTNCNNLSDACFTDLPMCNQITKLVLNNCIRLTDTALTSVVKTFGKLRQFSLRGLVSLTGSCFSEFRNLPCLTALDLSGCGVDNEGLFSLIGTLKEFLVLENLDLSSCPKLSNTAFAEVSKIKSLKTLRLAHSAQLTNIEKWGSLLNLTNLDISYSSALVMATALPTINKMRKMTQLSMQWCLLFEGVHHSMLKDLKNLKTLDISGWQNVQFGIATANACSNLEVLNVSHCGGLMDDKTISEGLSNLKVLGFAGFRFLPFSISRSAGMAAGLEALDLSGLGNLSDQMIRAVSLARSLKFLDMSQDGVVSKVTDRGMVNLKRLRNLISLRISGWVNVTDTGFEALAELTKLKDLDVSTCIKLTDSGVSTFHKLKSLTKINLVNCLKVTCDGLRVLNELRELEKVVVSVYLKGDVEFVLPRVKCIGRSGPFDQSEKFIKRLSRGGGGMLRYFS